MAGSSEGGDVSGKALEGGSVASITTEDEQDLDATLIVNGSIDVRKTHPNLYLAVSTLAGISVALGFNFWIFNPAFAVYGTSNRVWGSIFLLIGISKFVFLNLYRRLPLLRATMAVAVAFMLFFGIGTLEPVFQGKASVQLLILYLGLSLIQIPLLIEPFINPFTARRN